jgi:hypothetical protein
VTPAPRLGRTILTFVLAGPPAGTATLAASIMSFEALRNNLTPPPDAASLFGGLGAMFAFGYVLGALPAIISSLAVAALLRRDLPLPALLACAAVAGAVSSCLGLFWLILGPNGDTPKIVVVACICAAGAVAAVISTLLLARRARRPGAG